MQDQYTNLVDQLARESIRDTKLVVTALLKSRIDPMEAEMNAICQQCQDHVSVAIAIQTEGMPADCVSLQSTLSHNSVPCTGLWLEQQFMLQHAQITTVLGIRSYSRTLLICCKQSQAHQLVLLCTC